MGLVLVGCASCAMPRLRALPRALEQHAAPERPGRSRSVAMPFGDEGAPHSARTGRGSRGSRAASMASAYRCRRHAPIAWPDRSPAATTLP